MPEPLPLWRMIGPGGVMVGAGLSSAEYILWPYLTSRVGPGLLWVAVIAVLTQFFVNMEVGRYALATGEMPVTGFGRLWRPWTGIFIALVVFANIWPGLTAAAATAVTLAYDVGAGAITPIAILSLVVTGSLLTLSRSSYRTVEKVQFFKIGVVLVFLILALISGIALWDWQDLLPATVEGVSQPLGVLERAEDEGRLPQGLPTVALIGLLAFAGAGGCINLALGGWMRDKGFGMGAYTPDLTSNFSGEDESVRYTFPRDEVNLSRWRVWWKNANREQFVCFFVVSTVAIFVFSMLAYATLYNLEVGPGFDYVLVQGAVSNGLIAPWFGTSFWVIGALVLLTANLGIMDCVGRIVADALRTDLPAGFWSEAKVYVATVWGMVLFGCVILLGVPVRPVELILVSAALGVFTMAVCAVLLIVLNHRLLPQEIRPNGLRLGAMIWVALLYGALSIFLIFHVVRAFFSG